MYRGRKYYAGELGAKGTAHPRLSPSRPVPRPEALLPSWPPSETQAPANALPADSALRVVTLNLGGLTKSGYDELAQWLETEVIKTTLDVVMLQEHWRPSSEFCLPHWTWIQSGAQGRNGSFQHQGVAVLVNRRLASPDQVRFAEILPGRILRVLIPEHQSHRLRRKPITIINVYQHARSSESADTYQKRSRIWVCLQDVLGSVPKRHILLLGGDFNTTLRPAGNLVGQGVLAPAVVPQDQAAFQALVEQYDLCALNTWRHRRQAATYRDPCPAEAAPGTATQLDYLLLRSHHACQEARLSTACRHVHLASWKHGARHLPVMACIPLPNYVTMRGHCSAQTMVDTDAMLHEASQNTAKHHSFLRHIQDALAAQADPTWLTLDTALRKASETCYPKQRTGELRPWQESAVQVALKHVWHARNELRSARNTVFLGLQGIFQYWRRLAALRRTTRALRIQSHAQRRKQWCDKLRTAEEALQRHDAHHFFQVIAQLAPRQRRSRVQFRDAVGNIQSPAQELRTLHQFWSSVFHVPTTRHQQAHQHYGLQFAEATVCQMLRAMQPRKAVYPGFACSAAWKVGADVAGPILHRYLQQLFAPGLLAVPPLLTQAWLHFLPKPGKTNREPSHLRPIALQSIASKAVAKLLRYQLQPHVDVLLLRCPQYAYTCNRGTTEAIARIVHHCNAARATLREQALDLHAKHAGVKKCECVGGAMLSVDFSRAFDSLPRNVMADMLVWADVPGGLRVAIMQWHETGSYRLGDRKDAAQQLDIPASQGVKQGCMLAPTLWVLYTCFVFARLDQAMQDGWAAAHVTAFADDLNFRWVIQQLRDCERFLEDINSLLRVLASVGLQVNPSKSSLLLELRGTRGLAWLRKHVVHKGPQRERQFCYDPHKRLCLPLHKHCRYLGVVLAYDSYEDLTLQHRMAQAEAHRNRLRRVLQGHGGLGIRTRLRLWQVAIQTSQMYGLEATGVTEAGLRRLHAQMMKHLRAIAREPRHITKESDSNFLAKYGLPSVHQVLLTRSRGFAARHEPSTIGCRVGVACFDAHVIWLQASSVQLQLQAMQPQAHPRARLVAVPEDVVIYKWRQ